MTLVKNYNNYSLIIIMYEENGEDYEFDPLMEVDRVLQNYEDIHNPPPEYEEILPHRDLRISNFPKIKIKIFPGINSSDTIYEHLFERKNMNSSFSKTFKYNNNSMEITNIPLKTEVKLVTSMNDEENEDENRILLLDKKYKQTNIDIEELLEIYKSLNIFYMTFLNDFEYIHSNHNLNFNNKKFQIEKLLKSNVIDFKTNLMKIKIKNFEMQYLEKLRIEIYKFIKLRYELLFHYIRDFYDIQIEDFKKF